MHGREQIKPLKETEKIISMIPINQNSMIAINQT